MRRSVFAFGSVGQKTFLSLLLVAILLAMPVMLPGQGYFGTVSGELTDSSGAVLQGALSTRHEAMNLELRLEAENAFNHPVFGTPNTTVGYPAFGQISYLAVQPRQCQGGAEI